MIDKSNKIHPTAVLEGNVEIGKKNIIEANVVIEGTISIGDRNVIGAGCILKNNIKIGDDNNLIGNCSVGTQGEMGTKGDALPEGGIVIIGNRNLIREFMTINFPVRRKETRIGNNCYFMARTHVAHDCKVHDRVIMATNSLIGGGSIVYENVYVGLGSVTHQWKDIGESAMIGMQSANTKHIPPFAVVTGVPSKILRFNTAGAERMEFTEDIIKEAEKNFRNIIEGIYKSDNPIVRVIRVFLEKYPDCLSKFIE